MFIYSCFVFIKEQEGEKAKLLKPEAASHSINGQTIVVDY